MRSLPTKHQLENQQRQGQLKVMECQTGNRRTPPVSMDKGLDGGKHQKIRLDKSEWASSGKTNIRATGTQKTHPGQRTTLNNISLNFTQTGHTAID